MRLLLTFVLATVSVRAGSCPESCDCREFPKDGEVTDNFSSNFIFTEATCTGNVTQKLPESTEVLVLRNMLESDLRFFLTTLNGNITDITVSHVNLANNKSFVFNLTTINRVRALTLSNCKIVSSPTLVLPAASINFQSLDLSNNDMQTVKLQPIDTLEVLNLSANAIDSLNALSFAGLSALKSLDLTENLLSAIDDKVLKPLISLQHLNLSRNRLEILNEASFSSLLHLQQLDVSWNRLAKVAPGSLQLPSLARLLLAGNPNLGNFQQPALLVGTGRRLQTVDASRTGLKQVPAALTHSIRTLRLAGNSITIVNCGDLDSYPLLQLLDFTSNNLESVEDDALGRLDSLFVLYLTDNKLRSIPRSLPERLRVLHLEKNKIEQIRNVDLQGLPLLEVLLLSDNKIKTVEENSFTQLTSLETLDLSRNPISILTAGTFSGPIQLRVLRLSHIQAIPPAKEMTFPLSSPEHLVILDLSQSPGLARQLLADTAALAAAHELQELDLSNSLLNHIRSDLLHFLPQLRIFRLHGNPLNCTNLQWLALWMRKQDDVEYRQVTCSSPLELWGMLLIDLLEEESEAVFPQSINQTVENVSHVIATSNTKNNSKTTKAIRNPDGITVYKTSGNESSTKLAKMSDDEVSTANYTTENSSQMSPNYERGGSSNASILRETHNMTNDIRVTDSTKQSKINLIRDADRVKQRNATSQEIDKTKQHKVNINSPKKINEVQSLFNNNAYNLTSIKYNNESLNKSSFNDAKSNLYTTKSPYEISQSNEVIINKNETSENPLIIGNKSKLNNTVGKSSFKDNRQTAMRALSVPTKNYSNHDLKQTVQETKIQSNSNNTHFSVKNGIEPLNQSLNQNITNLWKKNFKLFAQVANVKKNMSENSSSITKESNNEEQYKRILNKDTSHSFVLTATKEGYNRSISSTTTTNHSLLNEINKDLIKDAFLRQSHIANQLLKDDQRKEEVISGSYDAEENVTMSNGKTSMYSGENHEKDNKLAHPGMLILIIGITGAAAALILITSRFSCIRSKKKNNSRSNSLENVEVSSILSVTELW